MGYSAQKRIGVISSMENETMQGGMESWLTYLKRGLSKKSTRDRISGQEGVAGVKTDLRNLRPFAIRHWRKAALGVFLVLFTSLFAFPQPLIFRYLVDRVMLDTVSPLAEPSY
jgi:hypothetical protein